MTAQFETTKTRSPAIDYDRYVAAAQAERSAAIRGFFSAIHNRLVSRVTTVSEATPATGLNAKA